MENLKAVGDNSGSLGEAYKNTHNFIETFSENQKEYLERSKVTFSCLLNFHSSLCRKAEDLNVESDKKFNEILLFDDQHQHKFNQHLLKYAHILEPPKRRKLNAEIKEPSIQVAQSVEVVVIDEGTQMRPPAEPIGFSGNEVQDMLQKNIPDVNNATQNADVQNMSTSSSEQFGFENDFLTVDAYKKQQKQFQETQMFQQRKVSDDLAPNDIVKEMMKAKVMSGLQTNEAERAVPKQKHQEMAVHVEEKKTEADLCVTQTSVADVTINQTTNDVEANRANVYNTPTLTKPKYLLNFNDKFSLKNSPKLGSNKNIESNKLISKDQTSSKPKVPMMFPLRAPTIKPVENVAQQSVKPIVRPVLTSTPIEHSKQLGTNSSIKIIPRNIANAAQATTKKPIDQFHKNLKQSMQFGFNQKNDALNTSTDDIIFEGFKFGANAPNEDMNTVSRPTCEAKFDFPINIGEVRKQPQPPPPPPPQQQQQQTQMNMFPNFSSVSQTNQMPVNTRPNAEPFNFFDFNNNDNITETNYDGIQKINFFS